MDEFRPASRKQGLSKGGLIEIQGPGGDSRRIPTYTCCHCNTVHKVPDDPKEIGFCARCHARECLRCAKKLNGRCRPFELALKAMEEKARFLRDVGA
jgi:hypothetical protein